MNNEQLFEIASRKKLRFQTVRGLISTEDLWDLPLINRITAGFDLDTVAKAVNRELKSLAEESFVTTKANPRADQLGLQLEIVKHIIATIQREDQERTAREGRKAERARLLEILDQKQGEKMMGMTEKQLKARIAELEA
jgi:hypothetical protein